MDEDRTLYEAVGGMGFFRRLVDAFYARVAEDPVLRPMYPEEDLGPACERLTLFLGQYWGGPGTYSQRRGHPMLRHRHMPFPIDGDARDRWIAAMRGAVTEVHPPADVARALLDYFDMAADAMRNRD